MDVFNDVCVGAALNSVKNVLEILMRKLRMT